MFDKDQLKKIDQAFSSWKEGIEKQTKKHPERSPEFKTLSEQSVERLYTPVDNASMDYERDLGFPGEYPYTRGVQGTMYRGRFWTMRQYAGYGSAKDTNERFQYLLEQGQTGLSIAFDLPTQVGYDSDHELAMGEAGRVGVAIDSVRDMEILFDQIPLDKVSTSMTANAPAAVLTAMYVALAEKGGIGLDQLRGTIQNDVLKEYIARGTYIYPPEAALRLTTDIVAYCAANMPQWNSMSISGYHMREAGCTAVQEVAFTLADGITYVDAVRKAGLDVDAFAPRLSFFFAAHKDFFEEIAKFRAARRLWARIMKERFKAKNPRSLMLRYHVQTAGCSLTAQQPLLNILRTGFEALSGVLGGCQSLHTNSYDEALALPTEEAVEIALRTQQLIAHETGVTETIDPLAGSYYVEDLTNRIEEEARHYLEKIDDMGGMVAAIESGYAQDEIATSSYEYQKKVESEERIIVGVNRFCSSNEKRPRLHRVEGTVEEEQRKSLAKLREERSNEAVSRALDGIRSGAQTDENLMPLILAAVKVEATLGEICDALRDVFGEYVGASSI